MAQRVVDLEWFGQVLSLSFTKVFVHLTHWRVLGRSYEETESGRMPANDALGQGSQFGIIAISVSAPFAELFRPTPPFPANENKPPGWTRRESTPPVRRPDDEPIATSAYSPGGKRPTFGGYAAERKR